MMAHIKRALRIGQTTQPVLLSEVNIAKQDPEQEQKVKTAVGNLVSSLLELERHSYEVRRELGTLTLNAVARKKE